MKNLVQQFDNLLQFKASDLTHPSHSSGDTYTNLIGPQEGIATPINKVEGGDPVLCGRIVGVADRDALTDNDLITVYTRGVFSLSATIAEGGLTKGETCYIDPSTAVISDNPAGVPFGVALEPLASGTGTIKIMLFGATPGAIGANS